MTDLSIVIANWNTRDLLARCLASVEFSVGGPEPDPRAGTGQPALTTGAIEILVVDNASTDGSPAMVRESFPRVHLIENRENVGFARANNQAIRQSQGRYILLLNSDTELYAGALENMMQFMEEHPEAGGCGPQLLNPDGTLQRSCHPMLTPGREFWRLVLLDQLWPRATYVQESWELEAPRRVEVIKGACLLLRRAALEQVGGLDEQYFMYSEEVDLCYRLAQAKWDLWWVPQARVKHIGEASSNQVPEAMYLQLYRSKVRFYRKVGGERLAARFKRLVWLAYWPRFAVAALATPISSSLAAQARTYRQLLDELPGM